jgi:hypothetical protein
MVYKSSFKDIIYPASSREPRVTRYRVVLTAEPTHAVSAIIQFAQDDLAHAYHSPLEPTLDQLLDRVIARELQGIRLDRITLVVQTGPKLLQYPINFNAVEFQKRGNPVSVTGAGKKKAIRIRSHVVVGGSVAFFVDRGGVREVEGSLAEILR